MRWGLSIMLAGLASGALAQMQQPAQPASSVQARFEAATAKLNQRDMIGAIADFEELERTLVASPKASPTNLALVRARLGTTYARVGRLDEARATIGKALDTNLLDKPAYADDRDGARLALAGIEELSFNHEAAVALYRRVAAEAPNPKDRLVALNSAARSLMFVDAPGALATIDEALAIATANKVVGKDELSLLYGTRGTVLLNSRQASQARDDLVRAVELRGGLTMKVDQGDIDLRANAALAMLALGLKDEARRYLAYTGAGHGNAALPFPAEAGLPDCGPLTGIDPEDSVVVRFDVLSSGKVANVMPIYSSRQGDLAYEFAAAVSQWAWSPADLKDVKPFFLSGARLELRCSTANPHQGDERASSALAAWLEQERVPTIDGNASAAQRAARMKQRLETAKSVPERIYLLRGLALNPVFDSDTRADYAAKAEQLAESGQVPPAPRLAITLLATAMRSKGRFGYESDNAYVGKLKALEAEPWVASDPLLRSTVRLRLVRAYMLRRSDFYTRTTINQIIADEGLPAKDPIKIAALVQLANLEAANKQPAAAAAAYELTGLSAQQCALIDDGPLLRKAPATANDYPQEARSWGFEGWSQVQYDIGADGRTRNARTTIAYPPEVFSEASQKIALRARYSISYRPTGDLACTASTRRVRYLLGS